MAEHTLKIYTAQARILYEIVLFRHLAAGNAVFSGEAALMLERDEHSGLLRSLHVTLLSVFNAAGEEVYTQVIKDPVLKQRLEATAIEQFYHPPEPPILLPKRIVEW